MSDPQSADPTAAIDIGRFLPIGTGTPWGKIAAVGSIGGERYYWMLGRGGVVSMMPADVVTASLAEKIDDPLSLDLSEDDCSCPPAAVSVTAGKGRGGRQIAKLHTPKVLTCTLARTGNPVEESGRSTRLQVTQHPLYRRCRSWKRARRGRFRIFYLT